MNHVVTLQELEIHWSIDDVDFAISAFFALEDAKQEAERKAAGQ